MTGKDWWWGVGLKKTEETSSPDNSRVGCSDRGYGRPPGRPRVPHPATYCSSTPRIRAPAVSRWQAHFHGLATSIRELSRLVLAPQVFVRSIEHWVSVHRDKIVEKLALFIRNFDEA